MNCTWLGQAGLLFDFEGVKVMIDPYLSDSVAKVNPANKRRVAIERHFFDIRPDILILTHDHLDHTDPETLEVILRRWDNICVLASGNAWKRVRTYGLSHNYVMFDRGTEWTQCDICFRAVHAQHSDDSAIGVMITWQGRTFYVTGDTLYHDRVIEDVLGTGLKPETVFLPVNGVGNNMNMIDAARFARAIKAENVVPIHFGLFDNLNPEKDFPCENKVVPEIYEDIKLVCASTGESVSEWNIM